MLHKFKFLFITLIIIISAGCGSSKTSSANPQPIQPTINKKAAARTNTQLGFYYLQNGDYQRAKAKLLTALQEAPDDPIANSAMGYFLEKTGEAVQAKEYYLRAIKLAPNDGAMYNNFGTFLCRQHQYTEALKQFKIAIADKDYLHSARAYENAGLCAKKMHNSRLAQQFFFKAIQHDPNLPTSLFELSSLYYQAGNYTKARDYFNRYAAVNLPTKEAKKLKIAINKHIKHT
jgi:type IV pilus assembly protein PilF